METAEDRLATISGVSGGITASYLGALGLADVLDEAGNRVRTLAATGAQLAASPDLAASALLSPGTAATAEAAVLAATARLLPSSAGLELCAVGVRVAVAELRAAEEAIDLSLQAAEYGVGFALGSGVKELP